MRRFVVRLAREALRPDLDNIRQELSELRNRIDLLQQQLNRNKG